MLLSQFITVAGLVLGYMLILGVVGFVAYITLELVIMRACGVKIVRRKRQ